MVYSIVAPMRKGEWSGGPRSGAVQGREIEKVSILVRRCRHHFLIAIVRRSPMNGEREQFYERGDINFRKGAKLKHTARRRRVSNPRPHVPLGHNTFDKTVEVMATTKMSLKLLIDTKANKVLFAEGGKDFVDFLFGLLSLPVGAVIKLLKGRSSVGCIGNLYQSVGSLDESFLQPNLNKDIILSPKVSSSVADIPLLMGCTTTTTTQSINFKSFYSCNNHHNYVANVSGTTCPGCPVFVGCKVGGNTMTRALTYVESSGVAPITTNANVKGYVQGLVMYMISDDLSVTPMSLVSSITMMNKYNVSKLDLLEERVVDVGMEEGLELLKASFQTKATLSAVFLAKKEDWNAAEKAAASPAESG